MRLATTLPLAAFARAPALSEESFEGYLRYPRLLYYAGTLAVGHLAFRPALTLTLSDYLFVAALLLALPAVLGPRVSTVGYRPSGILLGTGLFALGALLSTVGSPQPVQSLAVVAKFSFVTLVWLWLGTVLLRRTDHIRTAMACCVLSMSVSGAVALAQLLSGDGLVLSNPVIGHGRMMGLADHVSNLGASCAVALVAAFWLVLRAPNLVVRLGTLVVLVMVEAGLVLSGSMSGLVAAAAGVALMTALARPSARLVALVLFAAVAAFGLTQLQAIESASTPWESVERVSGAEETVEIGTLRVRLDSYRAALSRVARNPVIGVGPQPGGVKTETGIAVHNLVLGAWYEGGGFAALGLVLVIGSCAAAGIGALGHAETGEGRFLIIVLLACFGAFLVFAMGAPTLYPRYGWAAAALLLAVRSQQLARDREGPVSAATTRGARPGGSQTIPAARTHRGGTGVLAGCVSDSRRRS